jgi:hypothetical protein
LLFLFEGTGAVRICRWGIALVFASVTVGTFLSFISGLDISLPDFSYKEDKSYIEYTESALKEGIKDALKSNWGITKEDVEVGTVGFDFNTMTAEKIVISLKNGAVASDVSSIRQYFEKNLCKECEIRLEFG